MASAVLFLCLSLAFASTIAVTATPGVNFTTLHKTLVVTALVNGQPLAADGSSSLKWDSGNITVSWYLNDSFAGNDTNYKQVFVKLCYGAPSAVDRSWRKNNLDLNLSKTCKFPLKRFNYTASGGNVTYTPKDNVPTALYFVRAFVLNTTDTTATPGTNAVAFGQTTDQNRTKNLFKYEGFSGRNTGITIATVVFSVASYALLAGYFLVERYMKKNA